MSALAVGPGVELTITERQSTGAIDPFQCAPVLAGKG
jgi:hypothetical protein